MIALTEKQAEIYNAIFKPHHKTSIRKDSLKVFLKEEITKIFGHDILEHFLIPRKFYASENICYYLQNIILYAAYMGRVANRECWPSEDFCNQLEELCLNCIKVFFRGFQSAFDDDFCNHLKQTIILSFKNQVADKERLKEIIESQLRCLAYKISIKSTTAYQEDSVSKKLSLTDQHIQSFVYTWDMCVGKSEKEFVNDLLARCEKMLWQSNINLSPQSRDDVNAIQQLQNAAVNSMTTGGDSILGLGSYSARLGLVGTLTLACFIRFGISVTRGEEEAPFYLMGSFILALFCYLYCNYNEQPFVNSERKRYESTIKSFEEKLDSAVKIEIIEYSAKSSYREASVSPLPVRIYTFAELPAPVAENVPEAEKRRAAPKASEKGGKLVPSRFAHFPTQKQSPINQLSVNDLQDVPADMRLQCVDEKTNLFLLYDPNKEYESDWILPSLETARVSHGRANTGLISVGRLKAFNGREEVAVYELKNLHHGKGEAAQRLLIPVISLTKKDETTVRVLDCRGALFLKDGLHKKGMENYRFDSKTQQISHKGNISLGKYLNLLPARGAVAPQR